MKAEQFLFACLLINKFFYRVIQGLIDDGMGDVLFLLVHVFVLKYSSGLSFKRNSNLKQVVKCQFLNVPDLLCRVSALG